MDTKKVWFVTGGSKGLGLSVVRRLLTEGHQVAATSRTVKSLYKEVEASKDFLALEVEVIDQESVKKALFHTMETFGRIDVVVNNAGYGQLGTIEELTDVEARMNFDTNVFGYLNIIRSVMPYLRKQQSGHIINVSSIAGLMGSFPGWGIYCATKFAVVGMTESLSAETKEFGIAATIVYPGYFRTNFLDEGSLTVPQNPLSEYTSARETEKWHEEEMKGKQPGDPEKAARAFMELAEMKNPPLHFFMGSDSFVMANKKVQVLLQELDANEALSKSTDF